jgi:threonyl-tRNA synthetase
LPERLDATYIGEDGARHRPVMLHRAVLGSMERFVGILIENTAGKLPLWLAPVQVVVATITSEADAYAQSVRDQLHKLGLRVDIDLRNEKINYKIREHSLMKVPLIFVVGAREVQEQTVAIRTLGGDAQTVKSLEQALQDIVHLAKPPY